MVKKILAHCLKKDLDDALTFLTEYCLWTKREEVFTACESVRFLLVCIEEEKEESKRVQLIHQRDTVRNLHEPERNNVSRGTIQKEDGYNGSIEHFNDIANGRD